MQKYKKAHRELTNGYKKEQLEYIEGLIDKISNSAENR